MKNSNFIKNSILALLPISLSMVALFSRPSISEVDAYDKNTLPTTIKLNDNTDNEIRSYYSSLNSLNDSQRKGNNLLINLKNILMNGQKYYSYDSGDSIWKIYEIADRDWSLSPADKVDELGSGNYDKATNTINNYRYKSSDPYVHALYVDRNATNPKTAWGNHTTRSNEACIEREHIWPKSFGFDTSSNSGGARGDPMHLWAADGNTNGMHSNNPYGYVDTNKTYKDAGDKFSFTAGNLTGSSKNFYSTYQGTVFEPRDSDKGDIARACFYMAARYNNLSGSDNTCNTDNPNLLLTNEPSGKAGTSNSTTPYALGFISDLLKWNEIDPVDEYEIHRNNILFNNYTNNRNPFIDFPQWADLIWGGKDATAKPETDRINGGPVECVKIEMTKKPNKINYYVDEYIDIAGMEITAYFSDNHTEIVDNFTYEPSGKLTKQDNKLTVTYESKTTSCDIVVTERGTPGVHVTSVTLNKDSVELVLGETIKLVPNVLPSNAEDKSVTWSSSDEEIAKVDEFGNITPVAVGNCVVTVTTVDGGFKANCNVIVKEPVLTGITLSGEYKKEFNIGDQFSSEGLVVTASYSNKTTKIVTPTSITGYDMSKAGNQTVTVSYSEGSNSFSSSYEIVVKEVKKFNTAIIIGVAVGVVFVVCLTSGLTVSKSKKKRKGKGKKRGRK